MEKNCDIDSRKWLSSDKERGVGRGTVLFSAPGWTGREDRLDIRIVRSGKNMKVVSFRQLGVVVNDFSVDRIEFPITGGDKQILFKTNAASIDAIITSSKKVRGLIKSFTTVNCFSIDVNDTRLEYGFPGDPGLNGEFEISLIVSMGDNTDGQETEECITINGKKIILYQPGRKGYYLDIEPEYKEVDSESERTSVLIKSNLDSYSIEILECFDDDDSIVLDKNVVHFGPEGGTDSFNVHTNPEGEPWMIE